MPWDSRQSALFGSKSGFVIVDMQTTCEHLAASTFGLAEFKNAVDHQKSDSMIPNKAAEFVERAIFVERRKLRKVVERIPRRCGKLPPRSIDLKNLHHK